MKPLISVIIATFNAAKTIRSCLESIVGQKNDCIELIVIDGGSTDGTPTILADYASQTDLIVSEKDNGIYDAWNKGIASANGEWIMFIGADDTLESDAFAKWIRFLNTRDTSGIDYICAKNHYLGRDGSFLKVLGVPWQWEQFRRTMKVAHVASLHNSTLFREIGLYDLRFQICGDYELLLRKQERLKCLFLDEVIARMAIAGASYSMKAVLEANQIRRLHSGLPWTLLIINNIWQVLLYIRHKMLHLF